jgi:gluconolactonase
MLIRSAACGPHFQFEPNQRYPDPRIEVLDPSFAKLRIFSSTVEQLGSGMRWAEGPVWFGDGRYLLVSDIPNNRIMRYDEASGAWGVFRSPSNMANGLARDCQGRLLTCEHGGRRITRTEYDGSITVLADRFEGKRLNSPNDIVCQSNGAIWFTDPPFGIGGHWEGDKAEPELPHAVYRLDPSSGTLYQVLLDLNGPNGLAFSPDESVLYVVESRAQPHRLVWAFDVDSSGALSGKRMVIDAQGAGALDGIAVDQEGHIWCGWGSNGALDANADALDGVRVFNTAGLAIGHIHLPERCANVCFGGAQRNRLFMASSHSLYALYVETQGA